jgi:hypothetical protein
MTLRWSAIKKKYAITNKAPFEEISGGRMRSTNHMGRLLAISPEGWTWKDYPVLWVPDHTKSLSHLISTSSNISPFELFHFSNLFPMNPQANNSKNSSDL